MRKLLALVLLLSLPAAATEIHYAPAENLEKIDVAAIGSATRTLDVAAYVMTDHAVVDALQEAGARGVKVRLYVDGQQASHDFMSPDSAFGVMYGTPGVTLRLKRAGGPIQHLKAYCVDGHLLRTGSANFSASGLKHQDNDLLLLDDAGLCGAFERDFEAMWAREGE